MSKPEELLVYDRTIKDITQKTSKAYYNYNDLNRIAKWEIYLQEVLNNYGYLVSITPKDDWNNEDVPRQSDIDKIKEDINILKEVYYTFSTTPKVTIGKTSINYNEANDIEKILRDINLLLELMPLSFRYSDYLVSGDDIGLIDCKE